MNDIDMIKSVQKIWADLYDKNISDYKEISSFVKYILDTYGVEIILYKDENKTLIDSFRVRDSNKYLLFLLKWA